MCDLYLHCRITFPSRKFFSVKDRNFDLFFRAADGAASKSGQAICCEASHSYRTLCAARFRLENGLRIILMPDSRAGIFAYQSWFAVGSRDEAPERTGLAHLFEHLMFKGTQTHAPGVFDREMEKRGSQTNAATWVDWTYYTAALPAVGDNLETVVGFEVDRMTRLVLDEETFRSEVDVVKNERRLTVDDSVTGALSEELFALAFTRHPYRRSTIGSMAHLDATSVDDLRAFYRAYYAPNNAVVVVAGDIEPESTLELLANAYGPLPAQEIERPERPTEPEQTAPRQAQIVRPVVAPQIIIGYRAPAQSHPDFTALELLNDIATVGDGGRLYRRLVTQEHLATEIGGYVSPFAEPGLYELVITARPGAEPQQIVAVVQEELDALADGPTAREITKARHDHELGFLDTLKDAEGCADLLGHFEVNYGDFSLALRGEEQLAAVTDESLARVARRLFSANNRNVVIAQRDDQTNP